MDFSKIVFKRKASLNPYKKFRLNIAGMSFCSDFVNTDRGNMYPLLKKDPGVTESVLNGTYRAESKSGSDSLERFICSHLFVSEYRISLLKLSGSAGIKLYSAEKSVKICASSTCQGYEFTFFSNDIPVVTQGSAGKDTDSFSVLFRAGYADIFSWKNNVPSHVTSFDIHEYVEDISIYPSPYSAALSICGDFETDEVSVYIDNGVAFADMKPVTYTDGGIYSENGKVFLTMSSRLTEGAYQSIISWIPGTTEFKLEGALFFLYQDGTVCTDIASSVRIDRNSGRFLIWNCSFSHGHILAHTETDGEVLHGINFLDVTLMQSEGFNCDRDFIGKTGDEDPDFIYDEKSGKWYLTVCRHHTFENHSSYCYHLFESDNPFEGFTYVSDTGNDSETGGMIFTDGDGLRFCCGSMDEYRVYSIPDMKKTDCLMHDFPDGGFRGWGTLVPVKKGTRNTLYHITFDRVNMGTANWTYGNLYIYEGEAQNG